MSLSHRYFGVLQLITLGLAITFSVIATDQTRAQINAQVTEVPLEGQSYLAADEAYAAFGKADYDKSAMKAREAIALRPDLLRLHLLLIDALTASGKLQEAQAAITEAGKRFAGNPDLAAKQNTIRDQLAQKPAGDAYKAFAAKDYANAVKFSREAIANAPDRMPYRLLLLNALLAQDSFGEALIVATDAIAINSKDYVPLVWRGYINQHLGRQSAAAADFNAAMALPGLSDDTLKNARIFAADAALGYGQADVAESLLRSYPNTDPKISVRLNDAQMALAGKGSLPKNSKTMPAPLQDCKTTATGTVCTLDAQQAYSVLISAPPPPDKATIAYQAATRAYRAEKAKNYNLAIAEARKALDLQPESLSNRLLLVNLLLASGDAAAAETEATKAINAGNKTAELYAQRGYARNQQRVFEGAIADWQIALQRGLPANRANNIRLAIADAYSALKQPAQALRYLDGLAPSYETAIRKAYALQALDRNEEALAAFSSAASTASTPAQADGALRAQISTLVQLGRISEARIEFDRAIAAGRLRTASDADLGYLAAQVGNDQAALAYFDRAKANGTLPPRANLDAGYSAKRQFQNAKAVSYLKSGIDAQAEGKINLDGQQLFDVRREVSDITRRWGMNTAVSYSKVGSAASPFLLSTTSGNYTAQVGTELYFRPDFLYRDGSTFDVVGRLFQTLYDESGNTVGNPTTQGMVGARWKPFSKQNLVFEVDQLFKVGALARDDILLRAAYSYTSGTDLRVIESNWRTWQIYGEVDHYVQNTQLVALAEARLGQVSASILSVQNWFVFRMSSSRQIMTILLQPVTLFGGCGRISQILVWRDVLYRAAVLLRTHDAISVSSSRRPPGRGNLRSGTGELLVVGVA